MHRIAPALLCAIALTWSLPATADTLVPTRNELGKVSRIGKGVKEFGVDSLLIVTSRSETDPADNVSSTFSATTNVSPVFRYFLADNFGLSLNVGLLIKSESDSQTPASGPSVDSSLTSFGVLATVMADYYLRLAGNVFFKPGVGAGGFWTTANTQIGDTALKQTHTTIGGAGRLQASVVYFTSEKFNIRAGADIVALFGSRTTDGVDDSTGIFQLDVGWNVGFGYIF